MKFEIKSFAIEQADCFLIEIEKSGKYFNLLVDCGKIGLQDQIEKELNGKALNGIVVTHVDKDHIIGILDLLENNSINLINNKTFILYNKYDESLISFEHGQKLFEQIKKHQYKNMLIKSYAKNYSNKNKFINSMHTNMTLPVQLLSSNERKLADNNLIKQDTIYITMLSPNITILKNLMRHWESNKANAKLLNKSSIVFLLEFNGKSVLMLGDALVQDIENALKEIKNLEHIDYIKISHHGAKNSNEGLLNIIQKYHCKKAVVTIKTDQNSENAHPNRDLIKEIKETGCQIYTSTNYNCNDSQNLIHYIKINDKLIV